MKHALVPLLVLLNLLPAAAQQHAQRPEPGAKLLAVEVTGSQHYDKNEVLAASGLKLGQAATNADFQNAANALVETGVFTSVSYKYLPLGSGYRLEFTVEDADFLAVHFENFVWFTDQQLKDELKQRVPLFKGEVCATGPMLAGVVDALNGVLSAHGVPGRTYYRMHSRVPGAPVDSVLYLVSDVPMAVVETHFTGVHALTAAELDKISERVLNQNYESTLSYEMVADGLLQLYQQRGYIRAGVDPPQRKLLGENLKLPEISLTYPVTEGAQYKIASIQWSGNNAIPTSVLAPFIKLQPGAVANAIELENEIKEANKAFGARGYLEATVESRTVADDATQTVAYTLHVKEGPQFHMGTVTFQGLDKETESKLRPLWKLKLGDVYDDTYAAAFLKASGVVRTGQLVKIHRNTAPGNVVHLVIEF